MKHEISFAEMAEVMNAVVKAETKAENYKSAADAYEKASLEFDGIAGTPGAQRMIDTYAVRKKAQKEFKAAVLKVGRMLFDETSRNYNDVDFFRFANVCSPGNIERLMYNIHWAAIQQMKYINC